MTNKSKGKRIQDITMKECGRKPQACKNCLPKQVNALLVEEAQLVREVQDCTDAFVATIEWRTEDGLEVLKVLPVEYENWASIFTQE